MAHRHAAAAPLAVGGGFLTKLYLWLTVSLYSASAASALTSAVILFSKNLDVPPPLAAAGNKR